MIRGSLKEKQFGNAEDLTQMIEASEKLAEVVLNLLNRGYLFDSSIQKFIYPNLDKLVAKKVL